MASATFPRLVEIHQNVTHGILVPRWAPDLGRGTGQPLFLFHPPMIYYIGELWHLLGFDFVTAMNLACVSVVLLSAAGMFLLARLYFGAAGGWLGAAAFLYVAVLCRGPVRTVGDGGVCRVSVLRVCSLRIRSICLASPLTTLAARRSRLCLRAVLPLSRGAPVHALARGFPRSHCLDGEILAVLWRQACGFLLGLALSAFIWAPALAARQYAAMNRAVEGYAQYSNHFVYLHQLFYSPWGYGLSVPGPDDGMSFALGWSHLLLAAVVWIWICAHARAGRSPPVPLLWRRGSAALHSDAAGCQMVLGAGADSAKRAIAVEAAGSGRHLHGARHRPARPPALPAHRRWRAVGMAAVAGALDRPQPVAPALQTVGGRGSQLLDARAAVLAWVRNHHHGGSDAALDAGTACLHSGCRHRAFRQCRDPPAGPRAVLLVKSGERQGPEHHRNEHRLVSRLGSDHRWPTCPCGSGHAQRADHVSNSRGTSISCRSVTGERLPRKPPAWSVSLHSSWRSASRAPR